MSEASGGVASDGDEETEGLGALMGPGGKGRP